MNWDYYAIFCIIWTTIAGIVQITRYKNAGGISIFTCLLLNYLLAPMTSVLGIIDIIGRRLKGKV